MTQHIAGIDYGIRAPCLCIVPVQEDTELTPWNQCHFYYTTQVKSQLVNTGNVHSIHIADTGEERYESIAEYFTATLKSYDVCQVGLEGYAYGSAKNSSSLTALAENVGLLKYFLYRADIAVNIHAPSTVKKFATGRGNASKDEMFEKFCLITEYDLNLLFGRDATALSKSPVADMVDAYFISQVQRLVKILEEADV